MSNTTFESFDDSFGIASTSMHQPDAAQHLGWASPTAEDFTDFQLGAVSGLSSAPGHGIEVPQAGPSGETREEEFARLEARMNVLKADMGIKTPPKRVQTTTPRKRTASRGGYTSQSPSKRACPTTPTPSRTMQDATVRGPIETMWSPGVTPEQRRAMYDQMTISSPAAKNDTSPLPKRKAAPKKPRAPAQKKTAAPKKSAAPKKAPKKQNQQSAINFDNIDLTTADASAFVGPDESLENQRPVSELYAENFMSLPLSDKARLLLPLLRGIDPATGLKFSQPGTLGSQMQAPEPQEDALDPAAIDTLVSYISAEDTTTSPASSSQAATKDDAAYPANFFDEFLAEELPTNNTPTSSTQQNDEALLPTNNTLPPTTQYCSDDLLGIEDFPTDLAWWLEPTDGSFPFDQLPEDIFSATTTPTDLDAGMQIALNGAATINSPDGGAKRQREALDEHERRVAEGRRR